MDKTKLKIDAIELAKALQRLEDAIERFDNRAVGREIYILKQRTSYIMRELEIDSYLENRQDDTK